MLVKSATAWTGTPTPFVRPTWPGSRRNAIPPPGTQGYPELAPDLVVEVKPPSNSNPEMGAKASMWLSYGSQQAWILNPENTTVIVRRPNTEPLILTEDDVLDGGDLLPGFSTPVWRLFRRQR